MEIISNNHVHVFNLKIADTTKKITTGLMHVKSLPDNEGMIFIFNKSQKVSFWMKNTHIYLDMLFVDENNQIIFIHKNAIPLDEKNIISCPMPVKYVIEINGRLCDKLNIKVGDYIKNL